MNDNGLIHIPPDVDERHVLLSNGQWMLINEAHVEWVRVFANETMMLGNGQLVPIFEGDESMSTEAVTQAAERLNGAGNAVSEFAPKIKMAGAQGQPAVAPLPENLPKMAGDVVRARYRRIADVLKEQLAIAETEYTALQKRQSERHGMMMEWGKSAIKNIEAMSEVEAKEATDAIERVDAIEAEFRRVTTAIQKGNDNDTANQ